MVLMCNRGGKSVIHFIVSVHVYVDHRWREAALLAAEGVLVEAGGIVGSCGDSLFSEVGGLDARLDGAAGLSSRTPSVWESGMAGDCSTMTGDDLRYYNWFIPMGYLHLKLN
uniref:Uncharacterized protein n=1 Tax=Triticum urartu TaxID=4572 RepID=A0A8R7UU08_TRIUA